MHKSDTLVSFFFGFTAAFVPVDILPNAEELKEVSLFVVKALCSGTISLGVTYFGHKLVNRKQQKQKADE